MGFGKVPSLQEMQEEDAWKEGTQSSHKPGTLFVWGKQETYRIIYFEFLVKIFQFKSSSSKNN